MPRNVAKMPCIARETPNRSRRYAIRSSWTGQGLHCRVEGMLSSENSRLRSCCKLRGWGLEFRGFRLQEMSPKNTANTVNWEGFWC